MNSAEFYIGWQSQAPPGVGSYVRKNVTALCVFAVSLAGLFAILQRSIGVAVFRWGTHKTFTGILRASPYPHLSLIQPGLSAGQSDYLLVGPFKHGLDAKSISSLDGKLVSLKGTLIFRDNQTMIEALAETIKATPQPNSQLSITDHQSTIIDHVTLRGEIVDSKCYFGVMNPGRLTPHRGCAVRCISGGIPPVLLVHEKDGPAKTYLLVSNDGSPVNKEVLDMVAEPVQITGDLVQQGSLTILRADPSTYRRFKNWTTNSLHF